MPHKCVRCNTLFVDGSKDLLKGCSNCSGKFFFFVRKEALEKAEEIGNRLTEEEKIQIERDALEVIGSDVDPDAPIILDLESINIPSSGKFELDLVKLFRGEPVIYKLEEGKYIIDVAQTFKNLKGKK